jgi:hypothetical protein
MHQALHTRPALAAISQGSRTVDVDREDGGEEGAATATMTATGAADPPEPARARWRLAGC